MTIDHSAIKPIELIGVGISLGGLAVSLLGLLYLYIQIKAYFKQQHLEFHIKLADMNRDLLKTAFEYPELLALFKGKPIEDKDKQTRFIQMFMNQSLIMWMGKQNGIINDEAWYSLHKDISVFVNYPPVIEHWQSVSSYYIPAFANFVNGLISKQSSRPSESDESRVG